MRSRRAWLPALAVASALRLAHAEAPAPPARLYLRSETRAAAVTVRPDASRALAATCVAPCEADLAPGKYRLELDGIASQSAFDVNGTRTAHAHVDSRTGSRAAGLVALNVGGVIGFTMLGIGALGGPSWVYYSGGGTLLASGGAFLLLYRSDRVAWSLTPGAPTDLDQSAALPADRRNTARSGLGLRVAF
jgi:hypothetical protein